MGFRFFSRPRLLAMSLAAVTATTTLFAIVGTAGPASAATSSGCPTSRSGLLVDNQVSAGFTNDTTTNITTYTFSSLKNENPVGGVPGLMKYCVYPTPTAQPSHTTVSAFGDNSVKWIVGTGKNNFAFVRPGGNSSDIGLKNQDVTMGTATWSTLPSDQTIVLHINDSTMCTSLYGAGSSATCFVRPGPPRQVGPICNAGDSTVAYNALPTDVVDCLNPAIGFEAQQTSEFGNAVKLKPLTGRTLDSLKVDFQSFACQSGHWNGVPGDNTTPEPCGALDTVTPPGVSPGTFQWMITANIYSADASGNPVTLLATDTENQTIPYRPAADSTGHCTGAKDTIDAANRWYNPAAAGTVKCQSSIAKVLSFSNWTFKNGFTGTLPDTVVWTIAFDTSTAGYSPVGTGNPCNTGTDPAFPGLVDGGCPYDSLNVGDNGNTGGVDFPTSFISGAPYAGSDFVTGTAVVYASVPTAYNDGGALNVLRLTTSGWDGLRPLGEIITH